jgi:hypothetical protein
MIIVAGQDMAAMQKTSPQIAETAAANASILAVGKTVDGDKTISFVQRLIGKSTVSVSSGFQSQPGILGNRWVDRMDATFQEVDKVRIDELQSLGEGQFYFLFNGKLVRAATFFIGDEFGENFSVNKFLKVRGPTDKVPGLDQSVDESFVQGLIDITTAMGRGLKAPVVDEEDPLNLALSVSAKFRDRAGSGSVPGALRMGDLVGLAATLGSGQGRSADPDGWSDMIEDGDVIPDIEDIRRISGMRREATRQEIPGLPSEPVSTPRRPAFVQDLPPPILAPQPRERAEPARAPVPSGRTGQDTGRITDSIKMATRGETPAERHKGILGMFDYEDQVRRKATETGFSPDIRDGLAEVTKTETVAAMFGTMSRHMERMQQLLISEVADGDLGAQIMERAAPMRPTVLPHEAGEDEVRTRLSGLEQTIEKSIRGND